MHVFFTRRAEQDLDEASDWYKARSPEATQRWLEVLDWVIDHLEAEPSRFPPAIENQKFPIKLQQVVFGSGKRKTHRLVFAIRPEKVVVYAVRHLAQQELTLEDLT